MPGGASRRVCSSPAHHTTPHSRRPPFRLPFHQPTTTARPWLPSPSWPSWPTSGGSGTTAPCTTPRDPSSPPSAASSPASLRRTSRRWVKGRGHASGRCHPHVLCACVITYRRCVVSEEEERESARTPLSNPSIHPSIRTPTTPPSAAPPVLGGGGASGAGAAHGGHAGGGGGGE